MNGMFKAKDLSKDTNDFVFYCHNTLMLLQGLDGGHICASCAFSERTSN